MHRLFILAECDSGHAEEVGEAVAELEDVTEVHAVTGQYDLLIKVTVDDIRAISEFIQDRLHRVPHVRRTETLLSFRAYSEDIGSFVN